jgi:molybdopterin-containing oxidoreductase family iron-sulfur binding subunit
MGAGALAVAMGGGAVAALASAETARRSEAPAGGSRALGPVAGAGTLVQRTFRYGMVIDTRRCVGCKACVVACKAENKTPPGVAYTVVVEEAAGNNLDDRPLFMTKPCFHCEHPPCVSVCPVSATFKRSQDGIVVVDYDRCIGCRYCITACPYQARYFDFGENYPAVAEETPYAQVPSPELDQFRPREKEKSPIGNVRKCTFCMHLQDEQGRYDKAAGRWPACAKTCTGHAIHFGDFNDPESEVSRLLRERQAIRLKEELGTEPNVYYLL